MALVASSAAAADTPAKAPAAGTRRHPMLQAERALRGRLRRGAARGTLRAGARGGRRAYGSRGGGASRGRGK